MKTTHYLYIMATALLTFSACNNDDVLTDEPVTPSEQPANDSEGFNGTIGDQLDILAEEDLDGQPSGTRATMSDGAFASWATNDKISICDGTLMYTYQPEKGTINGANCSFQSKTSSSFATNKEGTFYAFYPADAVLGWNGTTVSTMIYTEQKYSENVENSGVMGPYMAAVAQTTDGGSSAHFTFGHVCSVIDVDLSGFDGGEVESVALYANSQVSVAGSMKFNVSTKAATISGNDGAGYSYSLQSEVVRVSQINATNPTVRFYILPMKQTAGFTITVRCSDGKYYTKSSSTPVGSDELNNYITSQTGVSNGTLCKPYYKKYKFGTKSSARTQNWMAMIPGNIKFNHLSIPGTHDAATSSLSGSAKCQAYTIAEQLTKGCRALDLRPSNNQNLVIYHTLSTGVKLSDAFDAISTFLTNNPTETVFVLIHEEESSHTTEWSNRVWSCVNNYNNIIVSHGWQGNLNPCRGKMVVIFRDEFRDGTNNGDLGCGRVGWPGKIFERSIFVGNNGSSDTAGSIICQDDYELSSSNDKLAKLTDMLTNYMSPKEKNENYLFMNNTNIAKNLSYPSTTSEAVNTAVLGSSTFTNYTGRFGIMMTDFLFSSSQKGDRMFELIHQQNYKYVYKNRTRCAAASASGDDTGVDISSDEYADGTTVFSREQ